MNPFQDLQSIQSIIDPTNRVHFFAGDICPMDALAQTWVFWRLYLALEERPFQHDRS